MPYKRADATTLKSHVGELVLVVGRVQEVLDPETYKIDSNGSLTAHVPSELQGLEQGEAYSLISSYADDSSIRVKHSIHIPKEQYKADLVAKVVATKDKHSDFFY